MKKSNRYPFILLIGYIVVWIILAINPLYRMDWFLENILVFLAVPALIFSYRKFRLSNTSYTLITIFMILHAVGAHYQYAEVPFGFFLQDIFNLSRNHYDRIVHFSFGLLLSFPIREVFIRIAATKGVWNYYLPLDVTLGLSAFFELLEWLIVAVVNPEAGAAYLGMQGDEWDAQKDMALALIGAFITMTVTFLFNVGKRGFWKKMDESISVKKVRP